MRIGVASSSYPTSPDDTVTAGVFVRDVAHEMVALGHEVHIITPRKYGMIVPDQAIKSCFIPWWGGEKDLASLSMRSPLTAFRYATLVASGLWHIPRYARAHRLDALIAMWAIPSGLFAWAAWKRWDIPYGVWALGSDIWARRQYPFGERIVRQVLRDAAFRFADGIQLARDAAELAGRDCEFVPSVRRLPTCTERPVSLQPGLSHFLYIGRYERNKGPDVLIKAIRQLLSKEVRLHLHMFGVGSLEESLRDQLAGCEDHISLGGYANPETVVAYMQACDWLVIPSRIESIPLVLVDALQMRLPLIVTDVGDMGELVHKYNLGQVVPAEDPLALAEAIHWAMQHPRPEFKDSLERAAQQFDVAQSAARCAQELARAVERKLEIPA